MAFQVTGILALSPDARALHTHLFLPEEDNDEKAT
jgi:hypothetical protein